MLGLPSRRIKGTFAISGNLLPRMFRSDFQLIPSIFVTARSDRGAPIRRGQPPSRGQLGCLMTPARDRCAERRLYGEEASAPRVDCQCSTGSFKQSSTHRSDESSRNPVLRRFVCSERPGSVSFTGRHSPLQPASQAQRRCQVRHALGKLRV
ncbi:hypothetical protein BC834DRAFT_382778 [Gloeopeniophorella convolvens]|nr:hypothetical protein BC834DRAFT_382778 [Gloeopeniophorella convolvens]